MGQVVDFLGRPYPLEEGEEEQGGDGGAQAAAQPLGADALLPLLNAQPDMDSREQIHESLLTGVKALDILTPLGRGQALQVVGPQGAGKTQLCVDAVAGQRGSGVRCVYAAVGATREQLRRTVGALRAAGCMEHTTVVAATGDRWARSRGRRAVSWATPAGMPCSWLAAGGGLAPRLQPSRSHPCGSLPAALHSHPRTHPPSCPAYCCSRSCAGRWASSTPPCWRHAALGSECGTAAATPWWCSTMRPSWCAGPLAC